MNEKQLRNLKISLLLIVAFFILAVITYGIYSFSLFWQTFAAGITISFLLVIVVALLILAIYLGIRNFLLKREADKYKNLLKQAKFDLEKCKSKINQIYNTRDDD